MEPMLYRSIVAVWGVVALAPPLHAQGYHVRLDNRFQSVAYQTLTGEELKAAPFASTLDASAWGFGIPGLKLHTRARLTTDFHDPDVWPSVEPVLQLLEGYAEYSRPLFTVQAGRTHVFSRLGFTGLDGAKLDVRLLQGRLRASAYGGWGLARAVPFPLTSEEVNPLGDFIPQDRQIVAGGSLGWSLPYVEGRILYQREIDRRGDQEWALFSERGAIDAVIRPMDRLTLAGGAEYDIAREELGRADARVTYNQPMGRLQVSLGGRRYRPFFELYSIWGVFSPTPYTAGFASVRGTPISGLEVWTRGEVFDYDDTGVASPIATVEDDGWRWAVGAVVTRVPQWVFNATYHVEPAPGASSLGFDASAMFMALDNVTIRARGGYLKRPLEYRINDAKVWTYGLRADVRPVPGISLNAEVLRYDETRQGLSATEVAFDQFRIHLSATLTFGSGADRPGLHPSILRMPERRPQ
jgi:hypothetical protein